MFTLAFLAATILPFSSEVALLGALELYHDHFWTLIFIASLGNILGAVVNWCLGFKVADFQHKSWFPISERQLQKAMSFFQKRGWLSLLFAWVPVIGDPITMAAGVMRYPFLNFLFIVSLSKSLRYIFLAYSISLATN